MKNYEASWLMNTSMPCNRLTLTPWGKALETVVQYPPKPYPTCLSIWLVLISSLDNKTAIITMSLF